MKATLYTFGYLSSRASKIVQELITMKTPIVDIRYSPNAKQYQWTRQALSKREGIMYYWVQNLGNELYKQALTGQYQEPRIKLHAEQEGLKELAIILETYGRAAIMCACASKVTCHRALVARLASEQLGVSVIHL